MRGRIGRYTYQLNNMTVISSLAIGSYHSRLLDNPETHNGINLYSIEQIQENVGAKHQFVIITKLGLS